MSLCGLDSKLPCFAESCAKDLQIFKTLPSVLLGKLIALLSNLSGMLTWFSFQFGAPTLKYILPVLTTRFIDKKSAREKIFLWSCENTWKEPIQREIYYVWLTIPHIKFSGTRNVHTMFLEQPCFLNFKTRELLFTSLTQDIKFGLFKKKLYWPT